MMRAECGRIVSGRQTTCKPPDEETIYCVRENVRHSLTPEGRDAPSKNNWSRLAVKKLTMGHDPALEQ